jgi:hypothetical protein
MTMPKIRFMICRIGSGLTATSRFLVRKSQKIFGQKKPSIEAAIWSVEVLVGFEEREGEGKRGRTD